MRGKEKSSKTVLIVPVDLRVGITGILLVRFRYDLEEQSFVLVARHAVKILRFGCLHKN